MDDRIRPVPPMTPRPAERQRDQRQRRQDDQRPDVDGAGAGPASAVVAVGAPVEAEPSPLIAALDRLRATGGARSADLAMIRLWRARRAYQEPTAVAADDAPPAVDAAGPGSG